MKITHEWLILPIESYPWDKTDYKPEATASIKHDCENIYLHLKSKEEYIKATYHNFQDDVYKDSCLEFFCNFTPDKTDSYMNFEANPFGTMLIEFGPKGDRLRDKTVDTRIFDINTKIDMGSWEISYKIPLDFIKKYFPAFELKEGNVIKCNFYKCGDETKIPHWGCWNSIIYPEPKFHSPEFFGSLVIG